MSSTPIGIVVIATWATRDVGEDFPTQCTMQLHTGSVHAALKEVVFPAFYWYIYNATTFTMFSPVPGISLYAKTIGHSACKESCVQDTPWLLSQHSGCPLTIHTNIEIMLIL